MLANMLDGIRRTGTDRLTAICPGHPDRTPSLAIREGERGLLLRCWSGCSLDEICSALGIRKCELFYDHGMTSAQRRKLPPRPRRFNWRTLSSAFEFGSEHHWLRAESIFKEARKLDVSALNDEELDQAWRASSKFVQRLVSESASCFTTTA